MLFVDDPLCRDTLWILGDNFTAKSYRTHFKRVSSGPNGRTHFIKQQYDYTPFCNSRFASSNTNMVSRIQNSLASGFNKLKNGILPRYILVVLDDDLITFLDFKKDGAATLLGTWIEWLVKEFNILVKARLDQLPERCKKFEPFFY